jgi:hypothetical protein
MSPLLNPDQFRVAGLRGRNNPVVKFPLKWAHEYVREGVSLTPSFPIDCTGGITNFGLMGNGDYGNCAFCGKVHLDMTTAAAAKVPGPGPNDTYAIIGYNQYDGNAPAPGPGCDLASVLLWWCKQGLIKAFAPVDLSDKATVLALMQHGNGLYIGVNLTDNNNTQFNNGQPFDPQGLAPDPNDGHCVVLIKSASPTGPHAVITWGAVQECTDAWLEACLLNNPTGEAYLVVTTEEQLALFEPALVADCEALGGTE